MACLPTRQRTAVVARYYLQWTVAETADHLGVSADAVRSLTKRPLADLRRQLDRSPVVPPSPSREG